jgi:beta-lactamase regulating signal transducer with metallopeptidase domain
LVLPLITFTKTIWVEPAPVTEFYQETTSVNSDLIAIPIQKSPIDWSFIVLLVYLVISIAIILKIGVELASFFRRIQKQNKQKVSDYTLIDSNSIENPFSFFSYIIINKNMFTEEEIEHILTHESVHVKQKHSIDVLFGKLLCALFWVNPIIWLYRKAMLQNLEFIADNETFQQIENKYEYQKTLLKVVTHQHNLSITNQFYQSLIKKRIVMLHTNQSHKKNAWKYATILPLLVGFMLLFQIETVAQVKENQQESQVAKVQAIGFSWDKNVTNAEMKSDAELLKSQGIDYKFSKVKRNKKGEIIAIKIEFNDGKGNKGVKEIKGDDPIEPIYFSAEEGSLGFTNEPDYSDYVIDEKLSKQFETEIKVKMVNIADDIKEFDKAKEALWIFDGKEIDPSDFKNAKIKTKEGITFYSKEEGLEKFGEKGKNGVIIINGASVIYDDNKNPKVISKYYVNGKKINENESKIIMNDKADMMVINKKLENIEIINNRNNVITIITDDGDHNIIYYEKYLKIPDSPSIRIDENGPEIFINGKKVDSKSFLEMDHSKIYFMEATEKETNENNIIVVKKIEVKTK